MNSAQIEQMVTLAKRNGLFLMEAMWMRFIPLIIDLSAGSTPVTSESAHDSGRFRFSRPPQPKEPFIQPWYLRAVRCWTLASTHWHSPRYCWASPEVTSLANIGTTGIDEQSAYVLMHDGGALSVLASSSHPNIDGRLDTTAHAVVFICPSSLRAEMLVYRNEMEPEHIQLPYAGNGYQFEAQSGRLFAFWQNGKRSYAASR